MAELAPSGNGPNRLFVILALFLGGLLLLGVVGLGGFILLQNLTRAPAAVPTAILAVTTPTRVALATATVLTVTATPGTPTEQATPTFVLIAGGATQTPGSASTPSAATTDTGTTPTKTPRSGQLPQSGVGEDTLLLAGGVVLVLIIFAARRARMT